MLNHRQVNRASSPVSSVGIFKTVDHTLVFSKQVRVALKKRIGGSDQLTSSDKKYLLNLLDHISYRDDASDQEITMLLKRQLSAFGIKYADLSYQVHLEDALQETKEVAKLKQKLLLELRGLHDNFIAMIDELSFAQVRDTLSQLSAVLEKHDITHGVLITDTTVLFKYVLENPKLDTEQKLCLLELAAKVGYLCDARFSDVMKAVSEKESVAPRYEAMKTFRF